MHPVLSYSSYSGLVVVNVWLWGDSCNIQNRSNKPHWRSVPASFPRMIPQYERIVDSDSGGTETPIRSAFRIRFGKLAVFIVMFPIVGFLFCVVWSLLYNFDQANATHCLVYNFLPSLSAAIGNYQPQRIVWQFSVLVHALPRYAIAFMYKNYHVGLLRKRRKELAYLACILNITELSSLVGLTLWTSSESYGKLMLWFGKYKDPIVVL